MELTASDAGRVQLALTRGTRVVARASVKLAADGTADYRLKLPKGTKAGRYTLKATYRTISASRSLTLTGKASAPEQLAARRGRRRRTARAARRPLPRRPPGPHVQGRLTVARMFARVVIAPPGNTRETRRR